MLTSDALTRPCERVGLFVRFGSSGAYSHQPTAESEFRHCRACRGTLAELCTDSGAECSVIPAAERGYEGYVSGYDGNSWAEWPHVKAR